MRKLNYTGAQRREHDAIRDKMHGLLVKERDARAQARKRNLEDRLRDLRQELFALGVNVDDDINIAVGP